MLGASTSTSAAAHDKQCVVDRAGNIVIPPNYERINYLGKGIYQCCRLAENPVAREEQSDDPKTARAHKALRDKARSKIQTSDVLDHDGHVIARYVQGAFDISKIPPIPPGILEMEQKYPTTFSDGLGVFHETSRLENDKSAFSYDYDRSGNPLGRKLRATETQVFGYMDPHHKIVIPARYYAAWNFKDGLAAVKLNNAKHRAVWAYIDTHGRVVSPKYWRVEGFIDDRSIVALNDEPNTVGETIPLDYRQTGRWGLIDKAFRFVIDPEYSSVRRVSEGCYTACKSETGSIRLFDREGQKLFDMPDCKGIADLKDGLYFLRRKENKRCIVVDRHGMEIFRLPEHYDHLDPLPNGLLLASIVDRSGDSSCPIVIDRCGRTVNELPRMSIVLKKTDDEIICISGLNRSSGAPRTRVDITCANATGRISKTAHFDGELQQQAGSSPYGFQTGLAVLEGVDRNPADPFYTKTAAVIDDHGNWVLKPEVAEFKIAESDRFIKTVYQQHFDSAECRAEEGSLGRQLHLLLKDYDLIGMSRAELTELIGPPDSSNKDGMDSYTLSGFGGFCANAYSFLQFTFQDDRVVGWRRRSGAQVDPDQNDPAVDLRRRSGRELEKDWFTENMILDRSYEFHPKVKTGIEH